jgi:predicted Holliday junction resolvase-like endonuclease
MYLIIFIIIIILVGILFLRRESLTLDELRKQIESAGPTLLPQFTRLQYEEKIRGGGSSGKTNTGIVTKISGDGNNQKKEERTKHKPR